MFKPFNNNTKIELTDELLERLIQVLNEASEILENSAYSIQENCLLRILDSATDRNYEQIEKLVLSNELLGGAGSVIDVWIEDKLKCPDFMNLKLNCFI